MYLFFFILLFPLGCFGEESKYGVWLLIGDSYSLGYNTNNDGKDVPTNSWPDLTLNKVGVPISTAINYPYNSRVGGTGFCATNSDGRSFMTELKHTNYTYIISRQSDDVKFVIALGGYNDATMSDANGNSCLNASLIRKYIQNYIRVVRRNYPNAHIAIGMVGASNNPTTESNLKNIVAPAYKDAAAQLGIDYIEGSEDAVGNNLSNDGLHPNVTGQSNIADLVTKYINSKVKEEESVSPSDNIDKKYTRVTVNDNNNVYYINAQIPSLTENDNGDPFMIKDGDTYYLYTTNDVYYTSEDLKTWSSAKHFLNIDSITKTDAWDSNVEWYWAPEVYKIGNTYYLLQSYITPGDGYPFSSNAYGYVGVARTDDLSKGFNYWKRINVNLDKINHSNGRLTNNYIDGNLLIDGDKYYLYFKAEFDQNIYVMELNKNFDPVDSVPTKVVSKTSTTADGWGNDIAEGPEVYKHDGIYSMFYSSGDYKATSGIDNLYAVGYAWSKNPKSGWTNVSVDNKYPFFFGRSVVYDENTHKYSGLITSGEFATMPIYAPGHNAIFNTGYNNELYNVYHSAYFDKNSGDFLRRKVNIDRMGTSSDGKVYFNEPSNYSRPLISGTKYNGNKYYQTKDFTMNVSDSDYSILTDGATSNAMSDDASWIPKKVNSISSLTLTMKDRYDISDIWLDGDNTLIGNSVNVIINDNNGVPYYFNKQFNDSTRYYKLQMPNIPSGIKTVTLNFSKNTNLYEVTPIRVGDKVYSIDSDNIKVTFKDNLNNKSDTKSYTYGSPLGSLSTPTHAGYNFIGWYTQSDGGTKIDSTTVPTADVTYYARWIRRSHKLIISNNVNSNVKDSNIYEGDSSNITPDNIDGYKFNKWVIVFGNSTIRNNTLTMGTTDTRIRANYIKSRFNLTINPNGGVYDNSTSNIIKSIDYNNSLDLSIPTRDGYSFSGWSSTCGTVKDNKYTQDVYNDCSVTAKWSLNKYSYTVKYELMNVDGNGYTLNNTNTYSGNYGDSVTGVLVDYKGFITPGEKPITIGKDESKNIIEYKYERQKYNVVINYNNGSVNSNYQVYYEGSINLITPKKDGYIFSGWNVNGVNTTNNNIKITENTTVIANYRTDDTKVSHVLSIDLDGGMSNGKSTYTDQNVNEGDSIVLPTPTKNNYEFSKWEIVSGNSTIKDNILTMGTSNTKLKAIYNKKKYSLTIDYNNGSSNVVKNIYYGDSINLSTPTREGYSFNGWSSTCGSIKDNKYTQDVGSNCSVTAKWSLNKYSYTVKYELMNVDGKGYTTSTNTYSGNYGDRVSGVLVDYKGFITPDEKYITIGKDESKNVIEYKYERRKYNVVINYNNGTPNKSSEYYYDSEVNLNVPTRNGYEFSYWSINNSKSNDSKFKVEKDTNVVANYNIKNYKITYNLDGGSFVTEQANSYTIDSDDIVLEIPTKKGYKFSHFTYNSGNYLDNNTIRKGTTGDLLITANYNVNTYKLVIDPSGGFYNNSSDKQTINVSYGEEKTIMTPTRDGYVFDGWDLFGDESKFDGDKFTMGIGDAKLTAKWHDTSYVLTIDANGGLYDSLPKTTINVKYNKEVNLKTPVRDGYTFAGWDSTCGEFNGNKYVLTCSSSPTITAKWIENKYSYIVKYMLQGIDNDNYSLYDTYTGEAKSGSTIKIDPKNIDGFETPDTKSIKISSDSSKNVIEYKYKRKKYKVNIDGDNKTISYKDTIKLSRGSKRGYNFIGWDISNGSINNDVLTVLGDTKVTEKYEPIQYKITYNLDGGSLDNLVTSYNVESDKIVVKAPTKKGYVFAGWKGTDIDGVSSAIVINKNSIGNREYTALWHEYDGNVVPNVPNTLATSSKIIIILGIVIFIVGCCFISYGMKSKSIE